LGIRPGVPLENIAILAENAGVRVVGIGSPILGVADLEDTPGVDEETDEFDGFSFWTPEGLPVIFVRTDIPRDRYNWAVGHELIHLVMHATHHGPTRQAESECQVGSKELFMPEERFKETIHIGGLTVRMLCSMAVHWNVTLESIVFRCAELDLITEGMKRYYMGAVNKGAGQDIPIRSQHPRFYRQMCEFLYSVPVDVSEVAKGTGASRKFVADVLSAHSGRPDSLLL
jgi:Zn-dependent peptidase ImmA (M78 family)